MRFLTHRVIVSVVLMLSGCSNPMTSRDVTREKTFQVGYVPGQVYRLKVDQSLIDLRSDDGKSSFVYADPRGDLYVSIMKAGTCFVSPLNRFQASTIGMLPAGTLIEVSRLRYETYVSLSDVDRYVVAYGRLRDSSHAGTEVALTYVSDLIDVPAATLRTRAQSPNLTLTELVTSTE